MGIYQVNIRHKENHWIPRILGVNAITLYPFILYKEEITAYHLAHELVHIRQIQEDGVIKFYTSYIYQYIRNRLKGMNHKEAYVRISYEWEAYNEVK